jgi:hypothetical protein
MKWKQLTMALATAGVVAAIGAVGSGAQSGGGATPDASGRFVPDLVAILPGTVHLERRRSARHGVRRLLTFSASAQNNGAGPLIVRTERRSVGSRTVFARQVVVRSDGRRVLAGRSLKLRYVTGGGHSHFHLQDFMRYELRTVGGRTLRRDRKQGFCLGDRYDGTGPTRLPGEPARAVFTGRCGLNRPDLRNITMGISVGYGDDYPRRVEGQYIDITGLPSGRYVLVLRADPSGRLLDMHADNNVSSMLLRIDGGARKQARILSWCTSTDSCAVPGRHRIAAWRIRG